MKYIIFVVALALGGCAGRQTILEDRGVALVIVNKTNTVAPDASDLREILLGRKRHWDNGLTAVVVHLDVNLPHRAALLDRVVGLGPSEYDRAVTSQMYSTGWRGPFHVANDNEAIRAVTGTKGAVAVIAPASLTSEASATVRVLMRL